MVKLTIEENDKRATFWIEPTNFLIKKVTVFDTITNVETNFVFKDYKNHKDIFWAKEIKISRPQFEQVLHIKNDEIKVNPALEEKDFLFNVPDNIEFYLLKE